MRDTLISCLSHSPSWGLGPNPGTCPEWESNWQAFGLQVGTHFSEPYQPKICIKFLKCKLICSYRKQINPCVGRGGVVQGMAGGIKGPGNFWEGDVIVRYVDIGDGFMGV